MSRMTHPFGEVNVPVLSFSCYGPIPSFRPARAPREKESRTAAVQSGAGLSSSSLQDSSPRHPGKGRSSPWDRGGQAQCQICDIRACEGHGLRVQRRKCLSAKSCERACNSLGARGLISHFHVGKDGKLGSLELGGTSREQFSLIEPPLTQHLLVLCNGKIQRCRPYPHQEFLICCEEETRVPMTLRGECVMGYNNNGINKVLSQICSSL